MELNKNKINKQPKLVIERTENKEILKQQQSTTTTLKLTNNIHRPSPYLKRVRLPKLNFNIIDKPPTTSISFPLLKQKEINKLSEDLITKIELIKLKNEKIEQKINFKSNKLNEQINNNNSNRTEKNYLKNNRSSSAFPRIY
ncbi:hypothetical protein Mgra_00007220 [Meloidogyne graminicola]|uniref:Uncharacterized protein n=1 Tax=Meloidogyne graminicola TaxID=189291 RepID=A0A8S9ZJ98_9BILA|nr:hypothetical protein Mgra_00007220 [Meloidogyne graminicola]